MGRPTHQALHAIHFAIEKALPKAFLLENSDQLQTTNNGTLAEAIITRLKNLQYSVHARVINTSNYGLPQNRSRLWIVGIRNDVLCHQFKWPDLIPHIPLDQLLTPKTNDPGHPDIRPTAPMAAQQVHKAARLAADNRTTGDWVVAEHCSKQFLQSVHAESQTQPHIPHHYCEGKQGTGLAPEDDA